MLVDSVNRFFERHMVDKNHSASSELKNDLLSGRYEPSEEEKANFKKLFDFLIERR